MAGAYVCDVTNDLRNLERDRLAFRHDALHRTRTDDVSECGLCTLDERLAKVRNTECCTVWVDDLEIDDGVTTTGVGKSAKIGREGSSDAEHTSQH